MTDLDDPNLYFNRELSWLEFNSRVLEEAVNPATPLLEQLKFLSIFTSNLDEFFMVRIAGLKKILLEEIPASDSPDGLSPKDVLSAVYQRTVDMVNKQYQHFHNHVLPELTKHNVKTVKLKELNDKQREYLNTYFLEHVFPVLTPLAVDPTHPFPFLSNQSTYLLVILSDTEHPQARPATPLLGLVEVPSIIPRLVPVSIPQPDGEYRFVLLEELISENLASLFLGFSIQASYGIRVTRNLDYNLLESEVVDLLKAVQKEVIARQHNEVVRLEVVSGCPESLITMLKTVLGLGDEDIYRIPGSLYLSGFIGLYDLPLKDAKDPAFNPRLPPELASNDDIFSLIASRDLLVHHPYESFYAVIEFINTAAYDPQVLAIKQTLYRTSGDSPIIDALITAAENGKQVTAVVELKARFDEKNNIVWARRLERSGVNVVFGFIGLKTHCKATLVIRNEGPQLKRYVHLASGNYNSATAKVYTDIGMFTADPAVGSDISALFNLLTGFNVLTGETKLRRKTAFPTFKKIAISPLNLRSTLLQLIDREIAARKKGERAMIMAKMNSLVDKEIIKKLYEASQAGVEIKLIVRGICCLRPGLPGISENIQVISIVDRFLEHSRILYCLSGGHEEVYLSSADWMPRNMDRRIEVLFPVTQPEIRRRIIDKILSVCWADNVKARELRSDGSYITRTPAAGVAPFRSQMKFIEMVREGGIQSIPYELAIRHNPMRKRGTRPVAKKGAPPKKPPSS